MTNETIPETVDEEVDPSIGETVSEDGESLEEISAFNQEGEDITGEAQPGMGGGGVAGVSYDVAAINERAGYPITESVVEIEHYDSEAAARASLEGVPQAVGGTDEETVSEIHPEEHEHPEPGPDGPSQEILDEAEAAQAAAEERAEELVEAGVIDSAAYQDEEIPEPGEGAAEEVPEGGEPEVEGAVGDDTAKPTEENTVAEIKEYLDAQGTSYLSSATKAELLELV